MTLMSELVDRTLRDWLEPADDQPTRLVLDEDIDPAVTVGISFDATIIGPEELELLGPGTLIEIDSEEMVVSAINEEASTIDVLGRGANGTFPTAHDQGALIYPHRVWRRRVIFDALADGVVQLWPDLYRVVNTESLAVSSSTHTEVPAAHIEHFVAPLAFWGRVAGDGQYSRIPIDPGSFLDGFPGSTTGMAFYVPGLDTGGTGYLSYKAKFARPEDETDDLEDDLGIPTEWHPLVILSAVAYLIAGREMDLVTQQRLSEAIEQQNYPAGTPSKIRDSVLRYRSFLMDQAKADLRMRWPVTVTVTSL